MVQEWVTRAVAALITEEAKSVTKSGLAAVGAVTLLGEHSQKNTYIQHILGLYLYSTGASRQQITVLNHLGLSISYTTLAGCGINKHYTAEGPFMVVYNNINWVQKATSQIVGRIDTQENGMCATLIPLLNASKEALQATNLDKSFDKAPPLSLDDLILQPDDHTFFQTCLVHTVLMIVMHHSGHNMQRFRKPLQESLPTSHQKIELHKTDVYPLPAMNINESLTAGNAEVVDAVLKELRLDMSMPEFAAELKLIASDQLSLAPGAAVLQWALFVPSLFHYKMAASHGFITTHLGQPNHLLTNPASLVTHNTILEHKPISTSLDEYADGLTWETLQSHAATVVDRFTDNRTVHHLRQECAVHGSHRGDMVFENAILFLRNALHLREFSDTIKAGDSGRVLNILKIWGLAFRGNSQSKYAYEILYLVHNITHVWPASLVKVVLNNWLVNPTEKPQGWHEVDLLQEHFNFWIKDYYQAHGSAASWEWLKTIAPCMEILRCLATNVHDVLGSKQGNRHAAPDLMDDINELMGSLSHHSVYTEQQGRAFNDDGPPAADVIIDAVTALKQFNSMFTTLQQRRRVKPLVGAIEYYADVTADDSDGHSDASVDNFDEVDLNKGVRPDLYLTSLEDVALDMDGYAEEGDDNLVFDDFEDEFPDNNQSDSYIETQLTI
ncbi:hypothetical protein HETIRDRAFT_416617 [Heterobasidion irregulare TC 32-1]|uniref:DUF6589 domain-containing protein n=1 Tax=Heterobasidion irregulare (strain TC 32-1) TaxID=747525 RepID=W4K9C6_HETIT|nr:uncharacterized protein HETIRDRAFT_416617 [Heterobasidion irregulare TC 32-1]ETW82437.1 hypothetical protein HETIRDRAFT_416617 [Heterobasidion irregulare TC 32-1]